MSKKPRKCKQTGLNTRSTTAIGDEFEALVHKVYKALLEFEGLDCNQVKPKHRMVGLDGQATVHDLYWTFNHAGNEFKVILECKHYKRKVSKEVVEQVSGKLNNFPGHKAIIVTTEGYQAGAYENAKAHGIEIALLKFADKKELAQRMATETKRFDIFHIQPVAVRVIVNKAPSNEDIALFRSKKYCLSADDDTLYSLADITQYAAQMQGLAPVFQVIRIPFTKPLTLVADNGERFMERMVIALHVTGAVQRAAFDISLQYCEPIKHIFQNLLSGEVFLLDENCTVLRRETQGPEPPQGMGQWYTPYPDILAAVPASRVSQFTEAPTGAGSEDAGKKSNGDEEEKNEGGQRANLQ